MRPWHLNVLGAFLVLLGTLAFAVAGFIQIIVCDYDGCEDGRTEASVAWLGGGVALWALAVYAFVRASRRR